MHAIEVAAFGGPEVLQLESRPDPAPGPGQLLIEVAASDVLFVDTLIRSGRGVDIFPIRPPYIPGNGAGGTVALVGDGVDLGWLGRRVVAHTGGAGGSGGYSTLAVADAAVTAAVPDEIDVLDATAVLHDGTTAVRLCEVTAVQSHDTALVLGAAGGMGVLLVQLLAARGVRVIGAAGGSSKCEVVAGAGAHAAIDYRRPGWTDDVLEATGGVPPTLVLDGVGGQLGGEAFGLIADGGRFSAHGTPSGAFAPIDRDEAARRHLTVRSIADLQYAADDRLRLMHAALEELGQGRIRPVIGQTFPLSEAAKAHTAIEGRETVAKTLLLA